MQFIYKFFIFGITFLTMISGITLAEKSESTKRIHPQFTKRMHPQKSHMINKPQNLLKELMVYQLYNARIDVLTTLTGKTKEEIKKQVEMTSLKSVLEENSIDRQLFDSKIYEQIKQVIEKAGVDGAITSEQKIAIFEKAALGGQRKGTRIKPWRHMGKDIHLMQRSKVEGRRMGGKRNAYKMKLKQMKKKQGEMKKKSENQLEETETSQQEQ